MRKIFFSSIICFLGVTATTNAQQTIAAKADTVTIMEKYWTGWLADLYDAGVVMDNGTVKISDEARQVIQDSNYRKVIFPATYSWQAATYLLKQMDLKQGFWYLINLYKTDTAHQKLVIETFVNFDKVMDMQKVLTSTFYTYALLNPAVCTIKNDKPVIIRPDIVEKDFAQLKEIIRYIDYYRKEKKG
jgi:hypothetical protein